MPKKESNENKIEGREANIPKRLKFACLGLLWLNNEFCALLIPYVIPIIAIAIIGINLIIVAMFCKIELNLNEIKLSNKKNKNNPIAKIKIWYICGDDEFLGIIVINNDSAAKKEMEGISIPL